MTDQTPESAEAQIAFTRWLMQLRTDVAETVNGVLLHGARPVPVGAGGTQRPTTSAGSLIGYGLRNLSDSVSADVLFIDPETAAVILPLALSPGESVRDWFGPGGIHLGSSGLVIEVTGDVDGAVYLRGAQ